MSTGKTLLGVIALALILWLLYPSGRSGPANSAPGTVEITFMGPGGPIAGAMEVVIRQFEQLSREAHGKDPAKPIYRVVSGQTAARNQVADPTRFLVSVAGGAPPNVIYFDRYAVAEWAARGAFVPLDPYIARDLAQGYPDVPHAGRYYRSCWDEAVYHGSVYGIPVSVDDRALFYDKDLLRRAGLVGPDRQGRPPRNWDELRAHATALTQRDTRGKLKVVGLAPNYGNSWLYMWSWMNGAEFMSADGQRCTLNSPEVSEALGYIKGIYDDLGGYSQVVAFQAGFQGRELDPFIQGKVAMKIDGYWALGGLLRYGRNVNFGVAALPVSQRLLRQRQQTVTWNGGWAYAIPSTARHKDAAWELIRYLSSPQAVRLRLKAEAADAHAQGQLYLPPQLPLIALNEEMARQYVYENPEMPARFKDAVRVFNDLLPVARYRPVTPVGQLLWNQHVSATENALYGAGDAQQCLDIAAANVQRALDRFIRPPPGTPIRSWTFFYLDYGALLAALAVAVFLWDTRLPFRRRLARLLRLPSGAAGAVIEGSAGGFFRVQWKAGFLFALPWIIGFIVFGGGPMLYSLIISFCDFDILNPARFTALGNYHLMFTGDPLFWTALKNTAFMLIRVPLGMSLSLAVALLLNQRVRGIAMWRTFFYLPAIVPMVAASVLWIWIFNPQGGLLNTALEQVGIVGPPWLQDANWSKPSLVLMGLWGAGAGMIIWLAGLKGIPQSLYEAAAVDGAGPWRQFLHVTLPQLTPYIFFNLVMGLIGTFQVFGEAFIMTAGGPQDSTLFYVYHLFNHAFRYGNMGYASAMAWVLVIIVMLLTIAQLKLAKRWVHYE